MSDGTGAAAPIASPLLDKLVKIAGETYTLRFSVRAMQAFREAFKVDTDGEVGARVMNPTVAELPVYLYGLTRTFHPELTQAECAELADASNMMDLGAACGDAFRAHSAPREKKSPAPGKPVNRAARRKTKTKRAS